MATTVDLNQNLAQCIHSVTHWGSTTYHNICSGTTTDLPWGPFDYIVAVGFTALGITLVLAVIFFVVGGILRITLESFR